VVSKSELLDHCWEVNFDGGPGAVEVLVHRLRRKIDRPGRAPAVVTIRGAGYIIKDDAT
jgi:two-component system OmpR family response regulator